MVCAVSAGRVAVVDSRYAACPRDWLVPVSPAQAPELETGVSAGDDDGAWLEGRRVAAVVEIRPPYGLHLASDGAHTRRARRVRGLLHRARDNLDAAAIEGERQIDVVSLRLGEGLNHGPIGKVSKLDRDG